MVLVTQDVQQMQDGLLMITHAHVFSLLTPIVQHQKDLEILWGWMGMEVVSVIVLPHFMHQ